jgi:hypothetical protein
MEEPDRGDVLGQLAFALSLAKETGVPVQEDAIARVHVYRVTHRVLHLSTRTISLFVFTAAPGFSITRRQYTPNCDEQE